MAIFTFINAWWISLFFALPFCRDKTETRNVNWKKMARLSTGLGAVATGAIALAVKEIHL